VLGSVGQQKLFAGGDDSELPEPARQRLEMGPASLEQLGQWLLTETARWRAQDARAAVLGLECDRLISVRPPGRLTQASVIRLR
jgi:hypothetical protein